MSVSVFTSKSSLTINTIPYRKKRLDVLVDEGRDILPVQNVSQPAVLTAYMHLVSFVPSRVRYVLWKNQFRH